MKSLTELELLVDLRQKVRELQAVRQAEEWLASALDEDHLAELVVQQALLTLHAEMGFWCEWDEEHKRFHLRAADDATNSVFKPSGYAFLLELAEVASQRRTFSILSPNVVVEGKVRVRSVLLLPLYEKEKLIGVIGVLNRRDKHPFDTVADGTLAGVLQPILQAAFERVHLLQTIDEQQRMLEAQYTVSGITHTVMEFGEMMIAILNEMEKRTGAEAGMAFYLNEETGDLNPAAASDRAAQLFEESDYAFPKVVVRNALRRGGTISLDFRDVRGAAQEAGIQSGLIRSALVTRIVAQGKTAGAFLLVNKRGVERFNPWDAQIATAMSREAGTVLVQDKEKKRLRSIFLKYVSPDVGEKILQEKEGARLGGERKILTVLFTDLRGSTALGEKLDPGTLVGLLNEYFDTQADVVLRNGGTIIRFIGDAMLSCFGVTDETTDHEFEAVKTAMQLQVALKNLNAKWLREGKHVEFRMGAGIATGEVIAGNIGSRQYTNFDLVGDAANLAARLSGAAEAGQILITHPTYMLVRNRIACKPLEPIKVKGKEKPVHVYSVEKLL